MNYESVSVKGGVGENSQELRFNIRRLGISPRGIELIITCDKKGTVIQIWNPVTNRWAFMKIHESAPLDSKDVPDDKG